jgi:hypothetical protein
MGYPLRECQAGRLILVQGKLASGLETCYYDDDDYIQYYYYYHHYYYYSYGKVRGLTHKRYNPSRSCCRHAGSYRSLQNTGSMLILRFATPFSKPMSHITGERKKQWFGAADPATL